MARPHAQFCAPSTRPDAPPACRRRSGGGEPVATPGEPGPLAPSDAEPERATDTARPKPEESAAPGRGRWADLAAVAAILVVLAVLFRAFLAHPGDTLYSPWSDVVVAHAGWKGFMARASAEYGGIAWWNPTYCGGMPAHANPSYLWFHPLHVLYHVLPPDQAVAPTFVLCLAVYGLGLYVWLRLCGLDRAAATVGAIAGIAAPRLLYHVAGGFLSAFAGIAPLPWAFAATEYASRSRTAWRWCLLVCVLGLILAGYAQIWVTSAYGLGLYVLFRPEGGWTAAGREGPATRSAWLRRAPVRLAWLAGAYLASMLIAAYQVLPTMQYVAESVRAGALTAADVGNVRVAGLQWLTAVVPQPWGDPTRMFLVGGNQWLLWEQSVAFGVVPLLLLLAGRRGVHRRLWLCLLAIAALCGLMALGQSNPLFPLLVALPGLDRFRFMLRFLFLAGVAVAGLTALAVQAWRDPRSDPSARWALAAALVPVAALVALAVWFARAPSSYAFADTAARDAWVAVALAAACAAVALLRGRTRRRAWIPVVLGVLVLGDAVRSTSWVVQMEDPAVVYPRNAPTRWLVEHAGTTRIADFQGAVHYGMPGRTGLLVPDGYEPMLLRHTVRYMRALTGDPDTGAGNDLTIHTVAQPQLFRLLGIRWLLAKAPPFAGLQPRLQWTRVPTFQFWQGLGVLPAPVRLWEDPGALPRAFVVGRARFVDDAGESEALRELDPRREVLVGQPPPVAGSATFAPADIAAYEPNRVSIRATANAPGYLVLSDAWYPAWCATRNGAPAPVLRADGMFRAVPLPAAGEWTVEFRYEPTAERRGALVTGVALLLVAGVGLAAARRRFGRARTA